MARSVADALAAVGDGELGAALRWSLGELDRLSKELLEVRDQKRLQGLAAHGDRDAQEQLRLRAVAHLRAAGVTTSDRTLDHDGFGPAPTVGLALPCLVVATRATRHDTFDSWRFAGDRPWFALEHRVAPRPMSRYERAVVSPLAIGASMELALRRMGPRVPDGRRLRDFTAFGALASTELPGVDVGDISDHLSPAWVPLPTSAIAHLCAGTADEHLDLDTLAAHEGFGPWPSWWKLAWVADDLGEGSW